MHVAFWAMLFLAAMASTLRSLHPLSAAVWWRWAAVCRHAMLPCLPHLHLFSAPCTPQCGGLLMTRAQAHDLRRLSIS